MSSTILCVFTVWAFIRSLKEEQDLVHYAMELHQREKDFDLFIHACQINDCQLIKELKEKYIKDLKFQEQTNVVFSKMMNSF